MNREVIRLEEEGWQALSSSPAAATEFYDGVLDERVVMLLPGNTLLKDRAQILQSMAGQPWQAYELKQLALHEPADDIAVVVYSATAHPSRLAEVLRVGQQHVRATTGRVEADDAHSDPAVNFQRRMNAHLRRIRGRRKMIHRFDTAYGEWRIRGRELCRAGVSQPISGVSAHLSAGTGGSPDRGQAHPRATGADESDHDVCAVIDLPNGQRVSVDVPTAEQTRALIFVQLVNQASSYFAALESADPTVRRRNKFQTASARMRMPLLGAGAAGLVAGTWTTPPVYWAGLCVLAVGLMCYFRLGVHRGEALKIHAPVRGRWIALNSPADRVPSHHLTAYGQGQAVDLVCDTAARPDTTWWPLARRPQAFPGFGQPILSPVEGVVVRVVAGHRDHWSRTSWPALLYLLVEGVREFLGPSTILGNHVVIDCGGSRYLVLAHLRRRSLLVRQGQRVSAGQLIAECGNSGNSTEPHVHVQAMDHPNPLFAAGIPIVFDTSEGSGWMPRASEALDKGSA